MSIFNRMVDHQEELDRVFHALSDRTRRGILSRLADGREHRVSDLAAPFSMSLAGVSKHLKVLEGADLVRRRIAGRTHYCRIDAMRLAEAQAWISRYERFWAGRLDALEKALSAPDKNTKEENG